jgi:capsular exopolysaccharide synthesis family protein
VEFRDYLNVIRARKWIIVEAVVIVTIAAVVFSLVLPPSYRSEVKVLITDRDVGAAIFGSAVSDLAGTPERAVLTQVQLMQLRPLAEQAIRELSLRTTPETLLKKVTISTIGQTNVITLDVTDSDAGRAAAIANALGDAYVEWSRDAKRESIKAAVAEVQGRLDEARAETIALGKRIQQSGKSEQLAAELNIATGLYTVLAGKLEELRVQGQLEVGSGRVVSRAVAQREAISPQPLRDSLLGLVVGLALGLGMAFLLEYLDNTVKTPEELEQLFGAPVLGHIPSEKLEPGEQRRLTIVENPNSAAAESYRSLRAMMDFIDFEHDIEVLLVTSGAPSEGKSSVASNLAAGLAQAGKSVILVNCDFHRPSTEQFFDVNEVVGLSDVLTGAHSLRDALQESGVPRLRILTAGKLPPNPSELLGSDTMVALADALRQSADWVIVDSPPLLAVADAAVSIRWADGVLIVARRGALTRDAVRSAREVLANLGARVVGVVDWGIEDPGRRRQSAYGGYYGGYYSQYAQGAHGQRSWTRPASAEGLGSVSDARAAKAVAVPAKPMGRRIAEFTGGLMLGLAAFAVVIAVAFGMLYGLDQLFGWGVLARLIGLWS